jgi:hypothetical protein
VADAAGEAVVDDLAPSLVWRIVPLPEQRTSSHDFCGFVVSRQNDGLAAFARMSKIGRKPEASPDDRLPVFKVHFVREICEGEDSVQSLRIVRFIR